MLTAYNVNGVPSKAEDEEGNAEESGHSVSDQWVGMVGTEVEAEPEGSSQGKQLTCQKVHLRRRDGDTSRDYMQ